MSNAARNNPRSPRYQPPPGTIPPNIWGGSIQAIVKPTPEWLASNPHIPGAVPTEPPVEACELHFVLYGHWTLTSSLLPQEKWTTGVAPVCVLHKMPLVQLRDVLAAEGMTFPTEKPAVQLVDA